MSLRERLYPLVLGASFGWAMANVTIHDAAWWRLIVAVGLTVAWIVLGRGEHA